MDEISKEQLEALQKSWQKSRDPDQDLYNILKDVAQQAKRKIDLYTVVPEVEVERFQKFISMFLTCAVDLYFYPLKAQPGSLEDPVHEQRFLQFVYGVYDHERKNFLGDKDV